MMVRAARRRPYNRCLLRIVAGVLSALLCLALAGCWDRREIEERTSVVAVAIDAVPDRPDMIRLSVQIPIPLKIAGSTGTGGSSGGDSPVKVLSSDGITVLDAIRKLQTQLNQELFYGHTRVIAIGEAVARKGLNEVLDPFRRNPQIRRLLWPIIVEGEGRQLLEANPGLEQIPTVYIMSLVENGVKEGYIPDMNLGNFFIDLSSNCHQPFMLRFSARKEEIAYKGIALFREDKMIGSLDVQETWAIERVRYRENGGPIIFPYEGDSSRMVSLSSEFVGQSSRIRYNNGRVEARIHIQLEGALLEKTFDDMLFKSGRITLLEQNAADYLAAKTRQVIEKLQKRYRADVIGIGGKIRAFHPGIWRRINWQSEFPEADIVVTYSYKLRNTGMEMD
ncbi:spore gernimation protein [Paenibacillus darwinianus]|uniref:Spore gernimation protein n=1 Tax=Paenibacillus darwinianus TaxID=1380763 RepID=A0A9W5S1H0_9BACL|nr:Ger(x)C family spore germination protein [Paenibacillus darwinianus]EXX88878.1 spore gernimation protein [Paenibacillus darwinianus]EXX89116.1 spore gernimation protein [Paenibacillus darwinianus]EXX90447.1 spore gernimation protein [Paenibacillus darwinianus]